MRKDMNFSLDREATPNFSLVTSFVTRQKKCRQAMSGKTGRLVLTCSYKTFIGHSRSFQVYKGIEHLHRLTISSALTQHQTQQLNYQTSIFQHALLDPCHSPRAYPLRKRPSRLLHERHILGNTAPANDVVQNICTSSGVSGTFSFNQQKSTCHQQDSGTKYDFSVAYVGSADSVTLDDAACREGLRNEVNACGQGGSTTSGDWTFT
jgi:hypothetical protein